MRHVVVLILFFLSTAAFGEDRIVRLAALEWDPYTNPQSPQLGTVTDTLRRAYAAVGYTLVVEFLPRKQVLKNAVAPHNANVGYFPQVYSASMDKQWTLSEPVGASALGFAQRSERQTYWTSLDDMERYRVGVVQDAVNSEQLDLRIELGTLKAESAPDEVALLLRLGSGKLDFVAIDSLVFAHLMGNDTRLASLRGQLVMNPRMIEQRSLHVAFRRGPEGRRYALLLAEGLRRIDFKSPVFTSFSQ